MEMNATIKQWFEHGQSWQDALLATGLVNTSNDTRKAIEQWAGLARELGFEAEALLSEEVLNLRNTSQHRAKLLAELLIRLDLTLMLYQIGEVRDSVSDKA